MGNITPAQIQEHIKQTPFASFISTSLLPARSCPALADRAARFLTGFLTALALLSRRRPQEVLRLAQSAEV
jgi:hypothetical protein